jgi:hypothetical protein
MNVLCHLLINDNVSNVGSSMPPICKLQMIKHLLEFVKSKKKKGLKKKLEHTITIWGSIWIIWHGTPRESRKET